MGPGQNLPSPRTHPPIPRDLLPRYHPLAFSNPPCPSALGDPLAIPTRPRPAQPHRSRPSGWFSHTACTQDFMRRFRIRCSWTGNTCWMIPRAASSGTVGGQDRWSLPAPGLFCRIPILGDTHATVVCSLKPTEDSSPGKHTGFSFRIWDVQGQVGRYQRRGWTKW